MNDHIFNLINKKKKKKSGFSPSDIIDLATNISLSILNPEMTEEEIEEKIDILPNSISGFFSNDLDIDNLQKKVIEFLDNNDENLKILEIEKTILEDEYEINGECWRLKKKIEMKEKEIKIAKENKIVKKYIEETFEVVERYKNIKPEIKVNMNTGKKEYSNENTKEERFALIEKFIDLTKKYFPININRKRKIIKLCANCNNSLENLEPSDGIIICPECNAINLKDNVQYETNDYEKYENSDELKTDKKNFMIAIKKLQGKLINDSIPSDIINLLDNYFNNINPKLSRKEIISEKCNKYGIRGMSNLNSMIVALKSLKLNKIYSEVYYICYIYWNWELINLNQEEEEQISKDYDLRNEIYKEIKETNSNINRNYAMYRHLQRINYNYPPNYFKITKNCESLDKYENYWEYISNVLGWTEFKRISFCD